MNSVPHTDNNNEGFLILYLLILKNFVFLQELDPEFIHKTVRNI